MNQQPSKSSFLQHSLVFSTVVPAFICYAFIWFLDAQREVYPWNVELFPPINVVLNSLKLLFRGEGGYAKALFGWLSFLSLFALAGRLGSAISRLVRGAVPELYRGQNLLLGLAFIALGYSLAGLFRVLDPFIAWTLFGAGTIFLARDAVGILKNFRKIGLKEKFSAWSFPHYFLLAWFGVWSCTFILVPTFSDFLQNQLGLPYYFMNERSLDPNPYQIISYFPQNCEMLLLHFVLLDTLPGLNLMLWGIWLVTTLLVYQLAAKMSDEKHGILAACWFSVVPVIYWIFSNGKNDLTIVLYFLAGILTLNQVRNQSRDGALGLSFLSGLFFGTALGVKFTALIFLPPVFVYLFMNLPKSERSGKTNFFLCFLLGLAVTSALWYLRSFYYTGNPVYPLFAGLFPTRFVESWHVHASAGSLIKLGFLNAVKNLVIILSGSIPDFQDIQIPSAIPTPFQWCVTFPLILLNFAGFHFFSRELKWILATAVYGLGAMLFFEPALRYFPIIVALFCAGTIGSVYLLGQQGYRWLKPVIAVAIFASVLTPTTWQNFKTRVLGAGTLLISGADPLLAAEYNAGINYPVSPQDLLIMGDYINRTLSKNSRILIVGEERCPLIRRRYLIQSDQPREIIDDWYSEATSSEALLDKMKSEGVTHILLNANYLNAQVQYSAPVPATARQLHLEARPVVTEFFKKYCFSIASKSNGQLLLLGIKSPV